MFSLAFFVFSVLTSIISRNSPLSYGFLRKFSTSYYPDFGLPAFFLFIFRINRQEFSLTFLYLTSELAARIAELNAPERKEKPLIWCVGVDTGAYQAVQCRLRRPRTFAGAMGLSGLYDMNRFLGSAEDDLVLRSSPLAALHKNGICDKNVLSKAEENSLLLCVGQGGYEGDALADTQALADTLSEVGFPCHLEVWGGDVSHDWYWWGKEFGMFAERLFG